MSEKGLEYLKCELLICQGHGVSGKDSSQRHESVAYSGNQCYFERNTNLFLEETL